MRPVTSTARASPCGDVKRHRHGDEAGVGRLAVAHRAVHRVLHEIGRPVADAQCRLAVLPDGQLLAGTGLPLLTGLGQAQPPRGALVRPGPGRVNAANLRRAHERVEAGRVRGKLALSGV